MSDSAPERFAPAVGALAHVAADRTGLFMVVWRLESESDQSEVWYWPDGDVPRLRFTIGALPVAALTWGDDLLVFFFDGDRQSSVLAKIPPGGNLVRLREFAGITAFPAMAVDAEDLILVMPASTHHLFRLDREGAIVAERDLEGFGGSVSIQRVGHDLYVQRNGPENEEIVGHPPRNGALVEIRDDGSTTDLGTWRDRFAYLGGNSSQVFLAIEPTVRTDTAGQVLVQERRGEQLVPYLELPGWPTALAADDRRLVIEYQPRLPDGPRGGRVLELTWLGAAHGAGCGPR